jgi:hypothetical protein
MRHAIATRWRKIVLFCTGLEIVFLWGRLFVFTGFLEVGGGIDVWLLVRLGCRFSVIILESRP